MKEQDKQTLFTFLFEILRLIFCIGQKHVEKNANENANENANANENDNDNDNR